MSEEVTFPKMRKFILQAPNEQLGETRSLEYTNYDMTPPLTFRIMEGVDSKWRWEILQYGWPIKSCPPNMGYSNDRDAYDALKRSFQADYRQ